MPDHASDASTPPPLPRQAPHRMPELCLQHARTAHRRLRQAREAVSLAEQGLQSAKFLHELLDLDFEHRLHDLLCAHLRSRPARAGEVTHAFAAKQFYIAAPDAASRGKSSTVVCVDRESLEVCELCVPPSSTGQHTDEFRFAIPGQREPRVTTVLVCYVGNGEVCFTCA